MGGRPRSIGKAASAGLHASRRQILRIVFSACQYGLYGKLIRVLGTDMSFPLTTCLGRQLAWYIRSKCSFVCGSSRSLVWGTSWQESAVCRYYLCKCQAGRTGTQQLSRCEPMSSSAALHSSSTIPRSLRVHACAVNNNRVEISWDGFEMDVISWLLRIASTAYEHVGKGARYAAACNLAYRRL